MIKFGEIIKKLNIEHLFTIHPLDQKVSRENELQAKLAQIIISSTDPEELKNKIIKEIAISLNTCRCFFIEYDSSTNNFKKITNSYNAKRESQSMIGYDIDSRLPSFAMKKKYMKSIIIDDTEAYIKKNKLEESDEEIYFKDYDIKASLTIRLEFGENFLGVLVVHYDEKKPFLEYSSDMKFLEDIAEHISIALYLSTLYAEEKTKKERERLLRAIISIMSEEYDLSQIAQKIFEILANLYNTQTVMIDIKTENLRDFFIYNLNDHKMERVDAQKKKDLISIYKLPRFNSIKNQTNYIQDTHNFVISNNLENSPIEEYFNKNNIKSLILLPILHENMNFGLLIMHFSRANPVSKDDLGFIKTVIKQLAIATKQIQNYEKEKKVAERESLSRNIIETIRRSLDLDETLTFICDEVAKLFHVQRATITGYADVEDPKSYMIKREYQVSPDIKGIADIENFSMEAMIEVSRFWKETVVEPGEILAVDNIAQSDCNEMVKEAYEAIGVKSMIGVPITSGNKNWGGLYLSEYNYYRHWSDEEKTLLATIADQVYIAIKQAELYTAAKKAAEKENLLRTIFEAMRNSLDANIIKKAIVTEIGKALNADICIIATKENSENHFIIDEYSEYRSSLDEKSLVNLDTDGEWVSWFDNALKNKQEINFANVEEFLKRNNLLGSLEEGFIREYNIKSSYTAAINYTDYFGYIIIHYTKNYRQLDESELDFIRLIAAQAGVALYQAKLYKLTQELAETEKFNRRTLEILRNTLDKTTIKSLFVKNIGQFFHADRVFFSDYDPKSNVYLPIDKKSEYLSDSEEKSLVGFDWSDDLFKEYIQPLLEKRELKILCWDDYPDADFKGEGFVSRFKDADVKSSYNLPVLYEGRIMGYFCIEFTKDTCVKLSDEDISRIRSMCTQAGIALYHAELFMKAGEASKLKKEFIKTVSSGAHAMLNNIAELFEAMSNTELQCDAHIKHINHINEIVKNLLEFTTQIEIPNQDDPNK